MKILMFGRGPIAATYGILLDQAGHDVSYYVRPGRAAEYGGELRYDLMDGRRGALGTRTTGAIPVRYAEDLDEYDLVVLSVSHHRLAEAAAFLAPRIGRATVLVLGNVWTEPLEAIRPLPPEQVVWGFPQAGGGFGADGVLHAALFRTVLFGTMDREPSARDRAARAAFEQAGLRIREVPDLRGWLLLHFVADAGMHAQGLRLGTLSHMIGDRPALAEALRTTRDLLPLLRARGVDLRRHRAATMPYRLPAWLVAPAMMAAITRLPIARTSLAAHTDPDAAEPRAVVEDARAAARGIGLATPRLDAAVPWVR